MTAIEIIDETVEYYKNNPRSLNNIGECLYYNNGNMCAFGRCATKKGLEYLEYNENTSVCNLKKKPNSILKDVYKGHSLDFWCDLQLFHDRGENWKENNGGNTLTTKGLIVYNKLIEKYGNGTIGN
jgi:hypothetical protein